MRSSGASRPVMKVVMIDWRGPELPPDGTRYQVVAEFSLWSISGSQGFTTTVTRPAAGLVSVKRSSEPSGWVTTRRYCALFTMVCRSEASRPGMKVVMIDGRGPELPPDGTRYQVVAEFALWSISGSQGFTTTVTRPAAGLVSVKRSSEPSGWVTTRRYCALFTMVCAVIARDGGTTSANCCTVTGRVPM